MPLLDRVVLPLASEEDATETAEALRPHLGDVERVVAVHVIEKAGGGIDKAPKAQREEDAETILRLVEEALRDEVAVETDVRYGTDVVDALFEAAADHDATAVLFTAREGNRFVQLLAGDTARRLVTEATVPVVALPQD